MGYNPTVAGISSEMIIGIILPKVTLIVLFKINLRHMGWLLPKMVQKAWITRILGIGLDMGIRIVGDIPTGHLERTEILRGRRQEGGREK